MFPASLIYGKCFRTHRKPITHAENTLDLILNDFGTLITDLREPPLSGPAHLSGIDKKSQGGPLKWMAHLSGHDFFLAALRAARFSNLLYNMLVKTQSSSSDITQKTQSSLSELLIGSNPLSLIGSNSPNSSDMASNGSIHIYQNSLVVPQDKIKLTIFQAPLKWHQAGQKLKFFPESKSMEPKFSLT